MSEKVVQLNEEVIKGQLKETYMWKRRGSTQRASGDRGGEANPGGPVRA